MEVVIAAVVLLVLLNFRTIFGRRESAEAEKSSEVSPSLPAAPPGELPVSAPARGMPLNPRRVRALVFDTCISAAILTTSLIPVSWSPSAVAGKLSVGCVALAVAFGIFRDSFGGAGPGKRYYGIRIVGEQSGKPAGFLAASLRCLILYVPLLGLVDAVVILVKPDSQRISDFILGYRAEIYGKTKFDGS